jgi:hypothetical protein
MQFIKITSDVAQIYILMFCIPTSIYPEIGIIIICNKEVFVYNDTPL